MPKQKKLTSQEMLEARTKVLDRANRGDLRWPDALMRLRKSLGMTQQDFARTFRLTSRRRVWEMEHGLANPTITTLERIAKPFGLTVGLVPKDNSNEEAERE